MMIYTEVVQKEENKFDVLLKMLIWLNIFANKPPIIPSQVSGTRG